jgi:hypothetical protein
LALCAKLIAVLRRDNHPSPPGGNRGGDNRADHGHQFSLIAFGARLPHGTGSK